MKEVNFSTEEAREILNIQPRDFNKHKNRLKAPVRCRG